jgi:hypothetical protein
METHIDPVSMPDEPRWRLFTFNRVLVVAALLLAVAVGSNAYAAAQTRTTQVVHHANGTECIIDNPSLIPRPSSSAQH